MSAHTSSPSGRFDTLALVGLVVIGGGAVAFSGKLFFDAYASSQIPAPQVDQSMLQAYEKEQTELLTTPGLADDYALGGEAGQTEYSQKLGYNRIKIADAMASVTQELERGAFAAVALTAEDRATLDRLAMGGVTPDELLAMSKQTTVIEQAHATFVANCAACHGKNANGLVGPNLTDGYYLHGHKPENVYKTLMRGVAAKGMPAWAHLGDEKVAQLTAYVLSLYGKNVEGKAPQGLTPEGEAPPG